MDDDDDDDDKSKKKDVKRRVCQQLEDTLKLQSPISHDLVIPVSGKWALRARTSQNLPKLNKHWEAYSKKASLSDETSSGPVELKLLVASEVPKLEKRWRLWKWIRLFYAINHVVKDLAIWFDNKSFL